MIPTSFEHETVWALLTGLVFGLLMGGFGGGLSVWAAWQWSIKRIRSLRISVRTIITEPVEVGHGTEPAGSVHLESADRQPLS